jgi:phage virion morphogenesis protein
MSIKFSLDIDRALDELAAKLTNMRPFWADVGELLLASTKKRFVTQKAPDGTPWAPNKQLTIDMWLRREGKTGAGAARAAGSKRILRQSGALSTSIALKVGSTGVDLTSPLPYANTMQFGATARSFRGGRTPWGDIPARPFIGLSKSDEQGILETIEEYLSGDL